MIINADDFGYTSSTTAAIVWGFERGFCSSATLMANMPATEEACELTHQHHLLDCIGLHLVLDEGTPLTRAIRSCPRFCNAEGQFVFNRKKLVLRLDTSEKTALAGEIRAQIDRLRQARIPLTHMDSHRFVHTAWAVGAVVLQVAREENIPYVRLMRNCGPGLGLARWAYRTAFNWRIHHRGLARMRYMGDINDALYLKAQYQLPRVPDHFEVMVHPDLDTQGRVVNLPFPETLEESIHRLGPVERLESFRIVLGGKAPSGLRKSLAV